MLIAKLILSQMTLSLFFVITITIIPIGMGISEGCFITSGGCSVHLAYHVHKSGHNTSINHHHFNGNYNIMIFYQTVK